MSAVGPDANDVSSEERGGERRTRDRRAARSGERRRRLASSLTLPLGRMPPFGVLIALGICNHLVLTGSRVAVSLDALAQGADATTVGALLALFALLPMFLAIPAGRLADRVGVRGPMLAGSIGMAGGMLVATLARGLPALFVTAALCGLSFMAFQVAAQYATGEMGGPERRSRNFAMLGLGYSTSSIAGPLIAGLLIDTSGFRAAFAVLTLVPLLPIAVLASNRIPFPGPHPAHDAHGNARAIDLIANPDLRRVFIINGMIALAWELHTLFVPIYGNAIGLSASMIGLILAAFAAATFTIRLSMPLIARRVPEARMLTLALYGAALVYLAIPFSRDVSMLMVLSFCLGLGLGAGQPMVLSLLHSLAPPGRMGEAAGVRMSLMNSMAVAVPLVFGAAGGAIGISPVLWSVGLFLATGGWLTRAAKSRTSSAKSPTS